MKHKKPLAKTGKDSYIINKQGAKMQIYQVGGAVRDKLLNILCHDNDYVVVGATENEMIQLGYKKVGKTFPVFLHPQTGEEYALARKEVKTGIGHRDFKFIFTPDISLQEDSLRRDFTCNALYLVPETGEIIDFHNGQQDIKQRVLRHISPHFTEDPLRVLRMCRFAAQLDFEIAPETMDLCTKMVQKGMLRYLSKDRIWQEFSKALTSPNFYKFIVTAKQCGVLKEILPEVEQLWQIPERLDYHPEGNSGEHTMLALKASKSNDPLVNFTVLLHDVGKTQTDQTHWPSHKGHDKLGEKLIKKICQRIKAPDLYADFASFTAGHHMLYHRCISDVIEEMAEVAVVFAHHQHKQYLERYLAVLKADMQGRAMQDFSKELHEFSFFESHMRKLIKTASEINMSSMPQFTELLEKVKNKEASNDILKKAYIRLLVEKNPPPTTSV